MDGSDRRLRHMVLQEKPRIGFRQPDIVKCTFGDSRGREKLILAAYFDAQKIHLRSGRRLGQQEQTLAESNLDLDRVIVSKDRFP